MLAVLTLGLLMGMRHAFEPDHMAAVASLSSRTTDVRQALRLGAYWGLGHTLTLFVIGAVALFSGTLMSQQIAAYSELLVGVMLVVLGADVIVRLVRERIHFHFHRHDDGKIHFHAHSHKRDSQHDSDAHKHEHANLSARSLMVGMMHGMAGSAVLIALAVQNAASVWSGVAYIFVFGMGSLVGMALLSSAIALPLRFGATTLGWFYNTSRGLIGVGTLMMGGVMIVAHADLMI